MKSNPVNLQTIGFGFGTKTGMVSVQNFETTAKSISNGTYHSHETEKKKPSKALTAAIVAVPLIVSAFFSPSIRDRVLKNGITELTEDAKLTQKISHSASRILNSIADKTLYLKAGIAVKAKDLAHAASNIFKKS